MPKLTPTDRTTPTRLPKRVAYDLELIYEILDEGLYCNVAYVQDGLPFMLPTGYCRIGATLYIHGSVGSHMIRSIEQGNDLCISVTLVDGIVLARSAFHHSINYRSVIMFGKPFLVENEVEKMNVLAQFTNHFADGRWDDVRHPDASELRRTAVLGIRIEETSAKMRSGPPKDEEEDANWPCWSGVLPLQYTAGSPEEREDAVPGMVLPDYLKNYSRKKTR